MGLRLRAFALALALASCRRVPAPLDAQLAPARSTTPSVPAQPSAPAPPAPPVAPVPPEPPSPWCYVALATADARAVDHRGHLIAVTGRTVRDESTGTVLVATLADEIPCPTRRDHLAFDADDNAALHLRGRLYVHRHGGPWSVTPICSDVSGEPWAARSAGGFATLGRRLAGRELAMLMTDERDGAIGWYATTALDRTITSALLEPDGSIAALEAGGHAIVVDRVRIVAGEVIAAADALWTTLSQTPSGIAMARDAAPDAREVVHGASVQSPFERERRSRPVGPRTLAVYVLEFGRLLAITDRGVEWSPGPSQPFLEVVHWPADAAASNGDEVALGWLPDGDPIVTTPHGAMSPSCTSIAGLTLRRTWPAQNQYGL